MTPQLNGWQRLWVVVSAFYLILVVGVLYTLWPTAERTLHRDDFITRMPDEARKHVIASYATEWRAREDRSGYLHTVLPNGAVLVLRGTPDPRLAATRKKFPQYGDLSDTKLATALRAKFPEYANLLPDSFVMDEDVRKVVKAYSDVVAEATSAARWSSTGYALLSWLVPCFALYALGWSVAWVQRGFRGSASPPAR
jgi:hypothetical protein